MIKKFKIFENEDYKKSKIEQLVNNITRTLIRGYDPTSNTKLLIDKIKKLDLDDIEMKQYKSIFPLSMPGEKIKVNIYFTDKDNKNVYVQTDPFIQNQINELKELIKK